VRGFEPPPKRWLPGHRGADLLGSPGQPVLAPLAGTVVYAGVLAGRGVVVLAHGTTRTTYQPVTATVRVGTVVPAGVRIGRLSAAGSHCAPRACLHWGLLRGDRYLDPLTLVGGTPVRLLPIGDERRRGAGDADRTAARGAGATRAGTRSEDPAAGPPDRAEAAARSPAPSDDRPSFVLVGLAALAAVVAGVAVARH
jgi:Peptidase family M23